MDWKTLLRQYNDLKLGIIISIGYIRRRFIKQEAFRTAIRLRTKSLHQIMTAVLN